MQDLFKMKLKRQIRYKTRKIRYSLIKLLSPTIWRKTKSYASYPRSMVKFLRAYANEKSLIGAEIGVWAGDNALSILEQLNIKKLFLIDPYIPYVNSIGEVSNPSRALSICKDKMVKFNDKVKFIIKKSSEAVNDVPDNLDFVYIDGNHDYEFVKRDIEFYYPKVRSGGVLGGHDFLVTDNFKGVVNAVIEFVVEERLKLFAEKNDWWVVKPNIV